MEVVRQKNVATFIHFPLVDADGDPVSSVTGADSEIDTFSDAANPDGFTDCTNEATEVGSSGSYYLSLTQAEMDADYITIQIKSIEAKTQWILIRTTVGDPLNLATTDDGGTINVTGGKIDGVALVDVTTTNTDVRGTDSAALASVATEARLAELDAANLPTDIAAIPTTAMRGTDSANTTTPPTTAAIATAVLASTIDTGIDMTKTLKVILALAIAKEVAVSGNVYTFKDQDGNTLVTITFAAGSSTAVIA